MIKSYRLKDTLKQKGSGGKMKRTLSSGAEFARVGVGAILGLALLSTIATSLKR